MSNTIKVKALRTYKRAPGKGIAYPPRVYDEPEEVAQRAIDGGYAEACEPPEATDAAHELAAGEQVTDGGALAPDALPDDFPAVEILRENGIKTFTDALGFDGSWTDFDGIGPAFSQDIEARLSAYEQEQQE